MVKNFWGMVRGVFKEADLLLFILDARRVEETTNKEILNKFTYYNKPYLYVINKVDLITKKEQNLLEERYPDAVFISAKEHIGTMKLMQRLNKIACNRDILIGVVGYPNTGKSSVINSLVNKQSAKVSSSAGETRAIQAVRISKRVKLLDCPGVLCYRENDEAFQSRIGAKDPKYLKDPELAAFKLMEKTNGVIEKYYGVEKIDDYDLTLERIAFKMRKLKKGGLANTVEAAITMLRDWQNGKIESAISR